MAEFQDTISCCGLRELNEISNHSKPADVLVDAAEKLLPWGEGQIESDNIDFSQVVFSQAISKSSKARTSYGDRLMAFIEDNGLGTVTRGVTNINPNSGNRLTVFVWAINRPALAKWYNRKVSNKTDK